MQLNNSSSGPEGISFAFPSPRSGLGASNSFASSSMSGTDVLDGASLEYSEEFNQTVTELEATRRQCQEEQHRVSELTEQLNALSKLHVLFHSIDNTKSFISKLVQENQDLAERIQKTVTNDEMKSMHDELSLLDEVRYVNNRNTVHVRVEITYFISLFKVG